METYFAPPEKASAEELTAEIETVSKNPITSALLHSISGLLAILDEHRQIVALNDSFLQMLGIDDPVEALGLRHGEVLQCIHAQDEPAGCGTTQFCSSCGAAIAIVSSLEEDKPVEKLCALEAHRGDKVVDIALIVRSHPIKIDKSRFVLIFLQDVTLQQQRAALERTFFHDINNMLNTLVMASDLAVKENSSKLTRMIRQASFHLVKEVAIQRSLSESEISTYEPMWDEFTTEQILEELKSFFANHPASSDKTIMFSSEYPMLTIKTDISLLLRVLFNMIINALEANEKKGVVKVWLEHENDSIRFCVWNSQQIPPEIANRIFQRNFSTKEQAGRGIGTFSMKLFGEKILGGKISFTSSQANGTVFKFAQHLS